MVAPANSFGAATGWSSPPPLAASTTAPRARTPSRSSASAIRGFTRRRLESQLPALPLELAPPAHHVLARDQLEAAAPVDLARVDQGAEGHQLEPLVAGRARGLHDGVEQPPPRSGPARLPAQRQVPETREAVPEVPQRHAADGAPVQLRDPAALAVARPAGAPQLRELHRHVRGERGRHPVLGL